MYRQDHDHASFALDHSQGIEPSRIPPLSVELGVPKRFEQFAGEISARWQGRAKDWKDGVEWEEGFLRVDCFERFFSVLSYKQVEILVSK